MDNPNPLYNPTSVATLSEGARMLSVPDLNDYALLAETQLGLRNLDPVLTGEAGRIAKLAVGLQVSFLVEHGVASRLYDEMTNGARRVSFSKAASIGLDPQAVALVAPYVNPPEPDGEGEGFLLVRHL